MIAGQKIVHAGLGIGEVQSRKRRTFHGQTCDFIQVEFQSGLTCLIRAGGKGERIRPLVSPAEVPQVLAHVSAYQPAPNRDYDVRYARNCNKYASGDLYQWGEVVKGLSSLKRKQASLARTEAELLRRCRGRMADELALATARSRVQVLRDIDRACRTRA
jgi:RNA polymerase-interacting CarD/CdnL/TRCF family regulator